MAGEAPSESLLVGKWNKIFSVNWNNKMTVFVPDHRLYFSLRFIIKVIKLFSRPTSLYRLVMSRTEKSCTVCFDVTNCLKFFYHPLN